MIEAKAFYRKVELLLEGMSGEPSPRRFAEALLPRLMERLGEGLKLRGVQLYQRDHGGRFRLIRSEGTGAPDLSDELTRRASREGGADIGELPWSGRTAAGATGLMALPDLGELVVALLFDGPDGGSELITQIQSVIAALQYAVEQHLRRRELEDLFEQARAIQLSLLPSSAPRFGEFDIAAVSIPARRVGGDFYDFLPVDEDTLALAVADASGHGLPAALQARDVATGLRMGVERDLKITRTVEKLSRVIHRSGLASRYISMFFGELELNGNLSYINAGHPPGLLLDDRGVHELTVGGMLLGPQGDATYKLGFTHVDRGAALALYTDGVTERGTGESEPFGPQRLAEWLRDWREGPSQAGVDDLISRLRMHGPTRTFEDDVTVIFVRRPR